MAEKNLPKLFGLIGKNIGYSFSRGFFANQFQEWQLPHTYVNFDLPDIQEFLSLKKLHPNLSGCNVTVPYKQSIIPYLNELSEAAQQIGAVNCIAFDQNKTIGHNTDVVGFAHSLDQLILPIAVKALVLGAGGASKAVQFVLQKRKIPFQVVARNPQSGQIHFQQLNDNILQEHLLIIQTTPVGTFPNVEESVAFPFEFITSEHMAIDLIYNPEQTKFLQKFQEKGAKTLNGLPMLHAQAMASWEIWQATF